MSLSQIREPMQKRSIEKKEKIIKEGFDLICKKGYYNTNTAQIAKYFAEHEIYTTKTLADIFVASGFNNENILEKTHIIINLIDDLCHEIVYHKHSELNYDLMTTMVIQIIVSLLND